MRELPLACAMAAEATKLKASVTARSDAQIIIAPPPRWGFFKGLLTGLVIEVPVIAAAVWVLSQFGIGDRNVEFMRVLRLTAVFAGFAAVLTAAGIGRLAAHASVDKTGGRRRAAFVAARAHALASVGLVIIAAVPHGHLPASRMHWLWLPVAGLIAGALCGALIGVICGGAAPITGVVALARRPTDLLRMLLDPAQVVRLGAAVRNRSTTVFAGMFEPAAAKPKTPPPPTPPPAPEPVAEPKKES